MGELSARMARLMRNFVKGVALVPIAGGVGYVYIAPEVPVAPSDRECRDKGVV
jgi:hypothetical protein